MLFHSIRLTALSEAGRARAHFAHELSEGLAPGGGPSVGAGVGAGVRPPLDERIDASPEHVLATGDVPLFSYYKQVTARTHCTCCVNLNTETNIEP